MQVLSQATGDVLDVGIDARLTGQLSVTLADACGLTTSIMSYVPETQLEVRLQGSPTDNSACTLSFLPLLFASETYQPEDLLLGFSCDIIQGEAAVETTLLELFFHGQAGVGHI